jgi:hypothetical protein
MRRACFSTLGFEPVEIDQIQTDFETDYGEPNNLIVWVKSNAGQGSFTAANMSSLACFVLERRREAVRAF